MSVFPYDTHMADYLRATSRGDIAAAADAVRDNLRPDDGAQYDSVIEIDLSALKPLINGPHSPTAHTRLAMRSARRPS